MSEATGAVRGGQVRRACPMTRYRIDGTSASVGIPLAAYIIALVCSRFGSTLSCNRNTLPIPAWLPISRRRLRSLPRCRRGCSRNTRRLRPPPKSKARQRNRPRQSLKASLNAPLMWRGQNVRKPIDRGNVMIRSGIMQRHILVRRLSALKQLCISGLRRLSTVLASLRSRGDPAARLNRANEWRLGRSAIMAREHPRHFFREAARRERQAWAYLRLPPC